MKQFEEAKKILDLVLSSDHDFNISTASKKQYDFIIIPGQQGPRWIIPANALIGKTALMQWRPYNFLSRIKWQILLVLYHFGLLLKAPGVRCIKNVKRVNTTTNIQTNISYVPIIYIGTPGPQQKAVVTMVSANDGTPQRVIKIALGDDAKTSMVREATILKKLTKPDRPYGMPIIYSIKNGGTQTLQSVVHGRLTSRQLTQAHIDWLLLMPKAAKATTLNMQRQNLQDKIDNCQPICGTDKHNLAKAVTKIQGGQIPLVLVHGDFAPWNLKKQANGKIAAIDWEDAKLEGLPLWDLCHFFLIQGHLFRGKHPIRALYTSTLVQRYLKGMGIKSKTLIPLTLLYMLLVIYSRNIIISETYKEYLQRLLSSAFKL